MDWLFVCFACTYLLVAAWWGALLNALTASAGNRIQPKAVLHGLFWPISILRLMGGK